MDKTTKKIKEKLKLLPSKAGVYLMKNSDGEVIYVGKALSLKNRVTSYFVGSSHDRKTTELVKNIVDFDYILTGTEEEALFTESGLIKKYKPKYNILLKDDKRYPFIKITLNEPFPRIFSTRKLEKDKAKYFGPYTDSYMVKKTLRTLSWLFPLRTCNKNIPLGDPIYDRPCINYQIGKCYGPCIGKISKKDYDKMIKNIIRFLNGQNKELIEQLTEEMMEYSENMEFEKAAKTRDKIAALKKIQDSQTIHFNDFKDRDILGIYKEENYAAVSVLKIIQGKIQAKEIYDLQNVEEKKIEEILEAFIVQYYSARMDQLPYKILLQYEPDNIDQLNVWLKNKIITPQRGEKKHLIIIAKENAFHHVEDKKLRHLRKNSRTIFPVQELKDKLNLNKLPRKMVCFDISTIQGSDTVSSGVYFENGKPKKKNYKRFIIETVEGQDDFASMKETLERYLNRVISGDFIEPDLLIIDGGKGQLSSAYSILKSKNLKQIEMISLAKRIEEVFLPEHSEPILLPRSSSALRLLTNIRDEAHRFAITFHRKRRSMRTLTSELDSIKGLGKQMSFKLLKEFGSVENIRTLTMNELTSVKGIGESLAAKIIDGLRDGEKG